MHYEIYNMTDIRRGKSIQLLYLKARIDRKGIFTFENRYLYITVDH